MPFIQLETVNLHYQCLGQGKPVVLIHGLAANLAFWYPGIASALAQDHQVIVFDLRGHGRSSIPPSGYDRQHLVADLAGLLTHLNLSAVHLVGHSLGARTAAAFTCVYPERVCTLTIADTRFRCLQPGTLYLRDWPYWFVWKQELIRLGASVPGDDTVLDFRMLLELDRIYQEVKRQSAQRPKKLSLKSRDLGTRGRARLQQLLETTTIAQEFDQGDQLSSADLAAIAVPTLALYGEHSHCLPTCENLQSVIPGCQATLIQGTGHFHPVIQPKAFVKAMRPFLAAHSITTKPLQQPSSVLTKHHA